MFDRRSLLKAASLAPFAKTRIALGQVVPGVTPTEIKIGNTMPYSGPASAYGVVGHLEAAFFRMIDDQGGINGRKINYISLDDGYSPPKTVEQTRRLIEQDGVAFMFQGLGTAAQSVVRSYLNARGIPQLFVATGTEKFSDPENYRWTIPWNASFRTEAAIYGRYILAERPGAKVGILYQNDDFGKDFPAGLKLAFGDRYAAIVVKEVTYEVTDATIDSQMVALQSAGIDIFLSAATPKFGAQIIRKRADLNWKPLHISNNTASSVGAVLVPAGPDKAVGLLTAQYYKDNTDPQWTNDPGMNEWRTFMDSYMPDADRFQSFYVAGYAVSRALVQVLKQCGNDLSRENIMRQATNLQDLDVRVLLPGIRVNTSPTNYHPIRAMQMARFNGKSWELFGSLIST